MPTPIPIPRPAWTLSTIKQCRTHSMVNIMGWTEDTFQRFKDHVMAAAQGLRMDTFAGPQAQDAQKWAQLVDECVKEFPALNDFAGRWPVEFYYTQYTHWRGMRHRRLQKTGTAAAPALNGSAAPPTDSITARPKDSRASRTQELKKRKEHPHPDPGEKENGSVDVDGTTVVKAAQAASQNRNAPRWALNQPVQCRAGDGPSSTACVGSAARREDVGPLTSQPPLSTWALKSVSSSQIVENTSAPQSSSLFPTGRSVGPSPQPKLQDRRSNVSSSQMTFNTSASNQLQFQALEGHNDSMARRRSSFSSSRVASNTAAPASSPVFPTRRSEDSSPTAHREIITNSSAPASSPPFPTSTSSLRRSQPVKRRVIFTTCVFCGFQPSIPSDQTTELQLFFSGRDGLRQVLTAIGVVADHHLRALLRLGTKKSEALLRSLTPEYLTYVEKIEVAYMLEAHIDKTCNRPAKVQLTAIPVLRKGWRTFFRNIHANMLISRSTCGSPTTRNTSRLWN
ncbi:hypothetical protein DFH09DRAFT_167108 [Mycena vulgaris]|nr:hypothetical protein DFH09DRAFT_167108 [Mycena vulgaris]